MNVFRNYSTNKSTYSKFVMWKIRHDEHHMIFVSKTCFQFYNIISSTEKEDEIRFKI